MHTTFDNKSLTFIDEAVRQKEQRKGGIVRPGLHHGTRLAVMSMILFIL